MTRSLLRLYRLTATIMIAMVGSAYFTNVAAFEHEKKITSSKKRKAIDPLCPHQGEQKLVTSLAPRNKTQDIRLTLLCNYFPKVLAHIMLEYAPPEGTFVSYVDLRDGSYQKALDGQPRYDEDILIIDVDPDGILVIRKYHLYKPASSHAIEPLPPYWNRESITSDFREKNIYQDASHKTVQISPSDFHTPCKDAEKVTLQTGHHLEHFFHRRHITVKKLGSPAVRAGQSQSLFYMPYPMTFQKLALSFKTTYTYLKQQQARLPTKIFAYRFLQDFMDNYPKHAALIDQVASDITGTLALCWGTDEDYAMLMGQKI